MIGSRYGDGGSTSMTGFRNMVSRTGNLAARFTIGTNLHEITTSFRVYDVGVLRTIPMYLIKTDCYAFFLESVFLLKQRGIELIEEPIYFDARENDTSKIPNSQIISSGFSLLKMIPGRFLKYKPGSSIEWWSTLVCPEWGVGLSILIQKPKTISLYHYISGIFANNEARLIDTYECLNCGVTHKVTSLSD